MLATVPDGGPFACLRDQGRMELDSRRDCRKGRRRKFGAHKVGRAASFRFHHPSEVNDFQPFAAASLESTQSARLARRSDIGTLGVDRSPLHINVCMNEKGKLSGAQRNVVICTASLDVCVKWKLT